MLAISVTVDYSNYLVPTTNSIFRIPFQIILDLLEDMLIQGAGVLLAMPPWSRVSKTPSSNDDMQLENKE
jgi:hypothetical protein